MSEIPEIMSIYYNENGNGFPLLNICNEFEVVITSNTFLDSIIKNTLIKAYWRFNFIKTSKLSFTVDPFTDFRQEPNNVILSLFIDKEFVGYTTVENMYNFATQAMATIKAIKVELEE